MVQQSCNILSGWIRRFAYLNPMSQYVHFSDEDSHAFFILFSKFEFFFCLISIYYEALDNDIQAWFNV